MCMRFVPFMAPERIVPIRVFVGHVAIQHGLDSNGLDAVKRRHTHLHCRPIWGGHADETLRFKLDFGTVLQLHGASALEETPTHVQNPLESFNRCGAVQVQRLAVDHQVCPSPVGGVEHLGEILWVPVFPPADFGAVRVVHPTHVASKHVVATVSFFEVGTLAEPAIANGKDALRASHILRVKPFLHDAPSVGFQVLVHGHILRHDAATQADIQVVKSRNRTSFKSGLTTSAALKTSESPKPTAKNPPAFAAATPAAASSKTMHSVG